MALDQEVKASIIAKYGRKDGDTGSAEVQIALLSEQIKTLTEHLKVFKKDHSFLLITFFIQYKILFILYKKCY